MSDDIHDWSGAYALNALDELERQRFERHLTTCAACSTEVLAFRQVAAELPVKPLAPTPTLRSRVLEEASTTAQLPTSEPVARRRSWPTTLVLVAAAFALLAAAGGVTLSVMADRRVVVAEAGLDRIASVMAASDAVVRSQTAQGTTVAVVSASTGTVIFPGSLPALPSEKAYQYWWIVGVDARSLYVGGSGGGAEPVFVAEQLEGGVVGITAEPAAGSPQPTTDPLVLVEVPTA